MVILVTKYENNLRIKIDTNNHIYHPIKSIRINSILI